MAAQKCQATLNHTPQLHIVLGERVGIGRPISLMDGDAFCFQYGADDVVGGGFGYKLATGITR